MKIKIDEIVIVEGKYDKIKLDSLLDASVISVNGFGLFRDEEKKATVRALAEKRGAIILCDSDGGGTVIRRHLNSILPKEKCKNLYIPEIFGKEKRKATPSKEGKLGVEGIDESLLSEVLAKYTSPIDSSEKITKNDLYDAGLYGGTDCAAARASLCRELSIPEKISTNSLLDALNALITKEKFLELTGK